MIKLYEIKDGFWHDNCLLLSIISFAKEVTRMRKIKYSKPMVVGSSNVHPC
jgi:hypothetical protein